MKIRKGFVTNSSSSSFIVQNLSDKVLGNEDIARMMEDEFNNFSLYNFIIYYFYIPIQVK